MTRSTPRACAASSSSWKPQPETSTTAHSARRTSRPRRGPSRSPRACRGR
jgi:hypothetical protein